MAPPTDPTTGDIAPHDRRATLRLAEANERLNVSSEPYGSDLAQMISALRARVDEEYRIMERLDTKARQAFALVAAFFTVVQAVAFSTFGQTSVDSTARVFLAIFALAAAVSVIVVAHRLRNEEDLQAERDLDPERILRWWDEATEENEVSLKLVRGLADVAKDRYSNNLTRAERYKKLDIAARIALAVTLVELMWAIVSRI